MSILKLFVPVALLTMALSETAMATPPLSLSQFEDCIGYNAGNYDSDCVLQSGEYAISSTLWIRRSNITVNGAWPWPMLRRVPGFNGDLMRSSVADNPSWVTVKNIYFHGNRWNGATSVSFELNLDGCSYCQVVANALFIGSPYFALGIDSTKPQAVSGVNFQGIVKSAIFSAGPECPFPASWTPSVCLNVTGSWFYDNGVGAIGFEPKNASITYNNFSFNHSECNYNAPGGQIDLDLGADNVIVANNTFEYGPTCPNGYWAVGVELHGTNITLRDNVIRYNAGEGIYMEGAQNVIVTSTNPSAYPISNNNRKGTGFPGCGGFPGIRVHSFYGSRPTMNIIVENVWAIAGHSFGVEVSACGTSGPPVNNVTIRNNCLAGNLYGGVYAPAAGYPQAIYNNQTSGCGGY